MARKARTVAGLGLPNSCLAMGKRGLSRCLAVRLWARLLVSPLMVPATGRRHEAAGPGVLEVDLMHRLLVSGDSRLTTQGFMPDTCYFGPDESALC